MDGRAGVGAVLDVQQVRPFQGPHRGQTPVGTGEPAWLSYGRCRPVSNPANGTDTPDEGSPCPAKGVIPRCPSVVRQPPPGDGDTLQLAATREPVNPIEVALPDTEALAQPEPGSPGQ
jgi:hypothetical protein